MIRRWYPILISIAAVFTGLALWLPASEPVEQPGSIQAERYIPDPDRLFPPPGPRAPSPTETPRVIQAERIILHGRDVQIVIAADGDVPGITMTHRNGYAQQLYFARDGKAVIGIKVPGQTHYSVSLWATPDTGIIQMRDRRGVFLMQAAEIYRGAPVR